MGARSGSGKREPAHLYQRNGIFYARITIGTVEQRRSLKTANRREAERRLKQWLAERSPYHGTDRHTFAEAVTLWLDAGDWKPKTREGYRKMLNGAGGIVEHFGTLFWDQVDRPALMRFVDARKAAGSGVATINRYLTVISGIAEHVKELPGWPEINPVRALPKKPRRERRQGYIRPPPADIDAFFARMKGTFRDYCETLLLTGMRKDELATLHHSNATNGRLMLYDTKSRIPRAVSLSPAAAVIVARQPLVEGSPYLFTTRNGGRYLRATEMWREIVKRAQMMAQREGRRLTTMTLHELRHEYAIRYLESGGSIYWLQKQLGHGSIKQTEWYLRYLTPEQQEAALKSTAQT